MLKEELDKKLSVERKLATMAGDNFKTEVGLILAKVDQTLGRLSQLSRELDLMPTLKEIQELENQAQEKIIAGDLICVRTVLWPAIKSALGQYTDLTRTHRQNMISVIHKRLDEYGLLGVEPTPINLEELKGNLQTGRVKVPEPALVNKWLPW